MIVFGLSGRLIGINFGLIGNEPGNNGKMNSFGAIFGGMTWRIGAIYGWDVDGSSKVIVRVYSFANMVNPDEPVVLMLDGLSRRIDRCPFSGLGRAPQEFSMISIA